ncbi:hypothetical protein [Cohnella panacarvi]|uniref:hypothetical protein n=1 Tax=Cohnella panacarvi TaxID=400776 RepID=UPI00047DA3A2|nr:hypothetical protein [Cohnella panacarvi]
MSFQPEAGARLGINGNEYLIGAHPNAQTLPYGQEGRQGTVYLLESEHGRKKKALKVFRGKFVNPSLAHHSRQIVGNADVSGLSACERFIVTPQNDPDLLHREPDLLYAVVMPWIEGPTWMDVMLNKRPLTRKQAFSAAFALVQALAGMEQRGLAHCDLSGPNVMLPMLGERSLGVKPIDYVQLIDLEQMYASSLDRPEQLAGGSPGYAPIHLTASQLWSAHADRFAGAVLIAEMLSSCFEAFYAEAWGESYFAPDELQRGGDRAGSMVDRLRREWGDGIADLFARAWDSEELSACPTFGEWSVALSRSEHLVATVSAREAVVFETAAASAAVQSVSSAEPRSAASEPESAGHDALLRKAKQYEDKGKYKEALELYRTAKNNGVHPSVLRELDIAIAELESKAEASRDESRKQARKLAGAVTKSTVAAAIIAIVGAAGYFGYIKLKDLDFGSGKKAPAVTSEQYEAKLESLKTQLGEKDKQIKELEQRAEALGKPMDEKSEKMRLALSESYGRLLDAAATVDKDVTSAPSKAFEAAGAYMDQLYASLAASYNLDEYFIEQTRTVSAYYYPYLYNRERNAQLNVKFFEDYKQRFEGGGKE